MNVCLCGIEAEEGSALCARCAALQILELPASAMPEEIKAAYHLLVKVWHPDRFQGDKKLSVAAEEKLKAINSAYLTLTSPAEKKRERRPRREAPPASASVNESPRPPSAGPESFSGARRATKSSLRSRLLTFAATGLVQRLLVLAFGLGASAVGLKLIDSQLASDPATGAVYSDYKAAMAKELEAPKKRFRDEFALTLGVLKPQQSAPTPAPAIAAGTVTGQQAPGPQTAAYRLPRKAPPSPARILPFITVDMTKDEVIAIAGPPISSTGDEIAYKGSELHFEDGKLVGWKIDPATSPMRVKLWPDAAVDTSLKYFSVGSTKNDVLVVQGTPTTLAQGKFAYGASEIYFQNNRVVSWKNDPASVPLRAISR
jgi:curved DNA-binding protein CbpA